MSDENTKQEVTDKAPVPHVITITHGVDGKMNIQSNVANKMTMIGLLDFAKGVVIRDTLSPPQISAPGATGPEPTPPASDEK